MHSSAADFSVPPAMRVEPRNVFVKRRSAWADDCDSSCALTDSSCVLSEKHQRVDGLRFDVECLESEMDNNARDLDDAQQNAHMDIDNTQQQQQSPQQSRQQEQRSTTPPAAVVVEEESNNNKLLAYETDSAEFDSQSSSEPSDASMAVQIAEAALS